ESIETPLRAGGHLAIEFFCSMVLEPAGQVFHDAQCVVPKSLDFNGFTATRRYYPVADLCVHPCELDSHFARSQQAAVIHFDSVAGAASVPGNDVSKDGVKFVANELQIACVREVCAS